MNGTLKIVGSHDHGDGKPEIIKNIYNAECVQDGESFTLSYLEDGGNYPEAHDESVNSMSPDKASNMNDNVDHSKGKQRNVIFHTLTIGPGRIEMSQEGAISSTLSFGPCKVWDTDYQTPYGLFKMTAITRHLLIEISPKKLSAHLQYELQMDGSKVSDSKVRISFVFE